MLNNLNASPTIPVKDLKIASDFYKNKLGLEVVGEPDEMVQFFKSGNTQIEVYKSEYAGTNKGTAMTWEVGEQIDKEVQNLKKKGVSFEHYDFPEAKLEGDIHVMGDLKVAWFKDPDGNILCLHNH